MAGYLFVHFTGEEKDGEQIYFSVSKDGLHWTDLNRGEPVLRSRIGMEGVRDPFPLRDPQNGKVYLIATDLRIEAGKGWEAAQYEGSRDLIVWESEDLVHWTEERACTVGIPGAGCVWAPEGVYDRDREQFLYSGHRWFVRRANRKENSEFTHPGHRISVNFPLRSNI